MLERFLLKARNAYVFIGATIGLIVAGLPPAIVFGYSLRFALLSEGFDIYWASAAGIGLAITLEVIGAVSAHVANHSESSAEKWRAIGVLLVYTTVGLGYMLFFEEHVVIKRTGIIAYLTAPMLYFSVAMLSRSQKDDTKKTVLQSREWQIEQLRLQEELKDNELDRELKKQRQADNKEVRLAKVSGNPKVSETFKEVSETSYRHWRKIPTEAKLSMREMDIYTIMQNSPISERTASNWIKTSEKFNSILNHLQTKPFALKNIPNTCAQLSLEENEFSRIVTELEKAGYIIVDPKTNIVKQVNYE